MMKRLIALLCLLPSLALAKTVTVGSGSNCGGACTYASLQAAITGEVAANANLTTLGGSGEILNIVLYSIDDTTPANITGFTTSATAYVNVYTHSTARHAGVWDDTRYNLIRSTAAAGGHALIVSSDYTRVTGLQIAMNANQGDVYGVWLSGGNITFAGNIVRRLSAGGANQGGIACRGPAGASTLYVFNNLVYGWVNNPSSGIALDPEGGTLTYAYSNTIAGSNYGLFVGGFRDHVVKNNIIVGSVVAPVTGFPADATLTGSGYNATDAAAFHAGWPSLTGDRVGQTFSFVDAGNSNYNLTQSDAAARELGTDSVESLFTVDILGATRQSPWSIGAFEADVPPFVGKTDAWRNALVNRFFRGAALTFPGTLNVRLYSSCPTATTAGTELSGSGYAAAAVNPGTGTWNTSASGLTSNVGAVAFGPASANWTVRCVAVESGGTIYMAGPVTGAPVTVFAGETARFPAGTLQIQEANAP